MSSRWLFTLLVAAVALARVVELSISRRNERRLVAAGATEAGAGHYPWMVALHTGFLLSCVAEVWLLQRPPVRPLAVVMLALLLAATATRYWVIATLGERWTTRVYCLPGAPRIGRGPYRFLRHPNYLAVAVEILALPLIHTAWWTAAIFSLANAVLLRVRIGVEDAALDRAEAAAGPRFEERG